MILEDLLVTTTNKLKSTNLFNDRVNLEALHWLLNIYNMTSLFFVTEKDRGPTL